MCMFAGQGEMEVLCRRFHKESHRCDDIFGLKTSITPVWHCGILTGGVASSVALFTADTDWRLFRD